MIFLSLRFYVKIIFGDSRSAKSAHFVILGALNFANLVNSTLFKVQRFVKFRASKCVEMVDCAPLESTKLISRKIWVIGKLRNFHTVKLELFKGITRFGSLYLTTSFFVPQFGQQIFDTSGLNHCNIWKFLMISILMFMVSVVHDDSIETDTRAIRFFFSWNDF